MPERSFSAPYDTTTKAITAVVCVLLMFLAWIVHVIFIVPLFPLLFVITYAYSPRGYEVSDGAIVVRRLIGNIRVPLADVLSIRAGTPDDFTGVIRLWGNGGLFGYFGLFRTAKLGKCHWYVTDRNRTVIVFTSTKILVLSPDDIAGFIAAAGMSATSVTTAGAPIKIKRNFTGVIVAIAVGSAAVVLAWLAIVYSPGPAPYTLTADSLTIHDKFYPVTLRADAVDTAGIRVVDLTPDSPWRPTLRTNGFANPHYQSGWFRVANGKTVRLYSAGSHSLVLIPPRADGTFVLYQPPDPAQFVQELRRRWASLAREPSS